MTSADIQVAGPMYLTHAPRVLKGWNAQYVQPVDPRSGYGLLEAYVCWGCGFVEWYCHGADRIPIHPHLMTELIDLDAGGPYR